jgi:hypothetical protein
VFFCEIKWLGHGEAAAARVYGLAAGEPPAARGLRVQFLNVKRESSDRPFSVPEKSAVTSDPAATSKKRIAKGV